MLEYDRIDISEGIDIKKCKETSKECNLCKFHYFLDKKFNHGPCLCDGYFGMLMKAVNIKKLAIFNHNGNHYHVNFASMSKKDVYNLIKNAVMMCEKEHYKVKKKKKILSVHTLKMSLKKINLETKKLIKKGFIRQNKLFH